MKLYGRKLSKKTNVYDTEPTIMVDSSKGLLKFSPKAIAILNMADDWLGMSSDDVETTGIEGNTIMKPEFYFYKAEEKQGFKMTATGNVNSRFYARELSTHFNNSSTDKFFIELSSEVTTIENMDVKFYKVLESAKGLIDAPAKTEAEESLKEIPELNDVIETAQSNGYDNGESVETDIVIVSPSNENN